MGESENRRSSRSAGKTSRQRGGKAGEIKDGTEKLKAEEKGTTTLTIARSGKM